MRENYTQHFISWYKFLLLHASKQVTKKEELLEDVARKVNNLSSRQEKEADFTIDECCQQINHCLNDYYKSKPEAVDINQLHADFFGENDFFLRKIPETVTKRQLPERFALLDQDSSWLKFKKRFKILFFYLSKLPFFFFNLFRKNKRPIIYWNHKIHVRQLSRRHFVVPFYKEWEKFEADTSKSFINLLAKLKRNRKLDIDDISAEFSALKTKIEGQIKAWYEQASNNFHDEFELVDTVEYKDKLLRKEYINKHELNANKSWECHYNEWQNTIFANFEDWRSQLGLNSLKANLAFHKEEFETHISAWQQEAEVQYQLEIDRFLQQALKEISAPDLSAEDLKKLITQIAYQSKKQLNHKLIANFEKTLSQNSLLNQLDKFEHQIESRIHSLQDEYVVIKSGKYDEPAEDDDLSKTSNHELLSFELVPFIHQKIDDLKGDIFTKMDQLLIAAGDLDEIVNYVLSTASNTLKEALDKSETQKILKEGFERAYNANQEIKEKLKLIIDNTLSTLSSIESYLNAEIDGLNQKGNISALKIRINKAKALHKSEALNKQIRAFIFNYWGISKAFVSKNYGTLRGYIQHINERFLLNNAAGQPNREVSDFLNIAEISIEKLPLIYKRLYAIEPLNDVVLFEGREKEINRFKAAYTAWQEGHYGDVILTGEKWSGMTSLINYMIKKVNFKHSYLRMSFKENNPDADDMIKEFAQLLKVPEILTEADLIDSLNNNPKKIIIVEDIQNLYLRVIGGQRAIIALIDIIAATQKNIFWIVSVSLHAYKYLERTLKINAFFSYPILLENMDAKTISNLIIKRNRVSGFKIIFEALPELQQEKKFQKLTDTEKQEFLKRKFFKELHAFSDSNVSMALMYWLLSTRSVDGHSITIKSFERPDFSFLNTLQADRVFLLHALVTHDGLSIKQMADVLNNDLQKMRFMVIEMLEDGVIIKESDYYLVNPIIFRNVIQLLKNKNLLS